MVAFVVTIGATAQIPISTAEELVSIRNSMSESYVLTNDIDLSDYAPGTLLGGTEGWEPLKLHFYTFDGAGYRITNLSINRPEENNVGLFSEISVAGTVKNLGIEISPGGVKGRHAVGGLVGFCDGTITNCYVIGNVEGNTGVGGLMGGGLEGGLSGINITNCYTKGEITGNSHVGGLIGSIYFIYKISNCYTTGNVNGADDYVGGLIGATGYPSEKGRCEIINCYVTGSVKGEDYVGGLVGRIPTNYDLNKVEINSCYVAGTVDGTGERVGGLAGENGGEIINSYYNDVNPAEKEGLKGTALDEMQGDGMSLLNWDAFEPVVGGFPQLLSHKFFTTIDIDGAAPEHYTLGEPIRFPANPTRNGHIFSGWYTEKSGGIRVNVPCYATESRTIYSQWKSSTAAETINSTTLKIYSPAKGTLRIFGNIGSNIIICDLQGRILQTMVSQTTEMVVDGLPSGLVIVRSQNESHKVMVN